MNENRGGCPTTKHGKMTSTASGIPYPCETCTNPNCKGQACSRWALWYKAKWRDLRKAAGVKSFYV